MPYLRHKYDMTLTEFNAGLRGIDSVEARRNYKQSLKTKPLSVSEADGGLLWTPPHGWKLTDSGWTFEPL